MAPCILCEGTEDLGGIKIYGACDMSKGQPCPLCQQYVELETEAQALKEALNKILTQQRNLRVEINGGHDSIARRLPTEVMSRVFESYVEDYAEEDKWNSRRGEMCPPASRSSPLTLGAVCHTWRTIAWSSPQLWTHCHVFLKRHENTNCVDLAEEWLDRSGQLPLSLRISRVPGYAGPSTDLQGAIDRIMSMINRYSNRWEDLHILCWGSELLPLFCGNSQGASNIRRLSLTHVIVDEERHFSAMKTRFSIAHGAKPRPSHVELEYILFQSLDINWCHVTTMHLTDSFQSLDDCINVLRQAPQLVECTIHSVYNSPSTNRDPIHATVHHALRKLEISDDRMDVNRFLGSFAFPGLTHLALTVSLKRSAQCIKDLITRSSAHLRSLSLNSVVGCDYDTLVRILDMTPFLTELDISGLGFTKKNGHDFFRLLANTSVSTTSASSRVSFLPELRSIRYGESVRWDASFWALVPQVIGPHREIRNPQNRPVTKIKIDSHNYRRSGDAVPICDDKNIVLRLSEAGISLHFEYTYTGEDLLKASMRHHGIK